MDSLDFENESYPDSDESSIMSLRTEEVEDEPLHSHFRMMVNRNL